MASFFPITPGKVHGDFKLLDDYTASWRTGTIHCCIAVSFYVLPAQRVSFDVLPTQRVYLWDCISDGFVLLQDNQSPADARWVPMRDQHRFIILERSLSWTRWIILGMGRDDSGSLPTNSWPPPPPMLNNVTTTYNEDDGDDDDRGGLVIDRNDDDDGGVWSDFDGEPNEDNGWIQRAIYHGMGRTYSFFLLLYSRFGYGSDKIE